MNRIHSTVIALVIGAAATAALYAAVQTVRLGQKAATPSISAHEVAARQAKLAAWRHSLHAALAKRPPALPKLPHYAPVSVPQPAPVAVAAAAPAPVTYVRPAPVVKYEHAPATTPTSSTEGDDGSGDDQSGDDGGGD